LTWTERKVELLARLGADWVVAYPTDQALLALSPEEFFSQIVCDALVAKGLVEGPNFYFGHNREGNIQRLRALCSAADISLDVVDPLVVDGQLVSSSRVRELLRKGAVDRARELLGVPYRIRGMVIHGAGRGAQIGFPTANLEAIDTMLPAVGVYAGLAWCEGIARPAAINLGPSPTFGEATVKVEVHVVGQSEPMYGQALEVDFLARLRDIQRFDSAEALVEQLAHDVQEVERIAEREPAASKESA
jgi:riboflavin kinase/FMN adenylyltransferase